MVKEKCLLFRRVIGLAIICWICFGTIQAQSTNLDSLTILEASTELPDSTAEGPAPDLSDFIVDPHFPEPLNLDSVLQLMTMEYPILYEISGSTIVKIMVDTTGHPVRLIFLKESHPIFTEATQKYIQYWSFEQGFDDNGRAIPYWVILVLRIQKRR